MSLFTQLQSHCTGFVAEYVFSVSTRDMWICHVDDFNVAVPVCQIPLSPYNLDSPPNLARN